MAEPNDIANELPCEIMRQSCAHALEQRRNVSIYVGVRHQMPAP